LLVRVYRDFWVLWLFVWDAYAWHCFAFACKGFLVNVSWRHERFASFGLSFYADFQWTVDVGFYKARDLFSRVVSVSLAVGSGVDDDVDAVLDEKLRDKDDRGVNHVALFFRISGE